MRRHRKLFIALALAIGSWVLNLPAEGSIPWMINYQGRLTDAAGKAITGSYTLTFRMYDASTSGTKVWEEQQTITLSDSDNGVFNVVLGAVTALTTVDFNTPLWLALQVSDDSEMTPRQRVTATGYALNADQIDGLDSTKFLRTDVDTASSGKLTLTKAGAAFLIKPSTDPASTAKMIELQNAAGTSKFSVDAAGNVSVAGDLTVSGSMSGVASSTGTTNATWTIDNDNTSATEPANGAGLVIEGGSGDASMLWDAANDELAVNKPMNITGTLKLSGSTSGYVGLAPAAAAGSTTYTLPSADGSPDDVLKTNGSGALSWASPGSLSGVGDITGVTAGTGLTGGGTSGDVTVSLTTPVSVANGGTGAGTAAAARSALGAAASGANSDITSLSSLSTPLSTAQGGTGAASLNDLITLGTHTTGNYVATASGTAPISVSGSGSENAAVTISCPTCLTSSSGAPVGSAFLTVGNDSTLTGERAITAGTGLSATDAGADSTYTLSVDQSFAPTWTGAHTFNKANAAGGSANALTLSATLGAMNGSDTYRGEYINLTNADHSGASNTVYGMDIAGITGDAQATEYALNIGSGWDLALSALSPVSINGGTNAARSLYVSEDVNDAGSTRYGIQVDLQNISSTASQVHSDVYGLKTTVSASNTTQGTSNSPAVYGLSTLALSSVDTGITVGSVVGVDVSVGNAGAGTLTDAYGMHVLGIRNSGGGALTNAYGLRIGNQGASGVTNGYGLYVDAQSGASGSNYAALFAGGNVGIGDTTPAALLTVGNGDKFQVASTGNVTLADGVLLDLSAINASGTGEGLKLPQATDVSAATAEGQISWDTDDDTLYVGTGSGVSAISGNPFGGSIDSSEITNGTIVNIDINAAAAIDFSKLAALSSGNILVGNGSNVAASVAMSGDVAISNTGATTIQPNSVALATDTTGNYVATVADSGAGIISVANSGSENAAVTLGIANDSLGPTQIDETAAYTWTGAHAFNKVNAAGGSADDVTLSGTLGAMDGSDTYRGLYLNFTNADHSGASNTVYGMDIAGITGDAQATEYALNIGSGWDRAISAAGNSVFILGANNGVQIDASSTPSGITTGALEVNASSSTTGFRALDVGTTITATGGINSIGIGNVWDSSAIVAGSTASNMFGHYTTMAKTGADTNNGTYTMAGYYADISNTGSTDAGTKITYGGFLAATGDTAGTSTAVGLYATASGADNNFAGIFNGGNVGIGDTSPAALLTVGNGDKFQVDSSGNVTLADGTLLDLSAINVSSATEGLKLPQAASCASGTANGQLCWDNDTYDLYIGTGSGAQLIGGASTGGGDITAVTAGVGLSGGGTSGAVSLAFDSTELTGNRTWGDGTDASILWTYNLSGTDPVVTFGNGVVNVSTGTLQQGGTAVSLAGHGHAATDITSGTLATARGGTNLDTSASTGIATITAGTWSATATTGSGNVVLASTPTISAPTISGNITYSGTQPKRTIVLTAAGALVSPSSTGCATAACADQRRSDGSTFPYYTLDFDKDTAERAYWSFIVPDSMTGATATFTPIWTATGGTSGDVVWQIHTGGYADNETFVGGALGGTTGTSTDTFLAVNKLHIAPVATITHDWNAGDLAVVEITRLASNVGDTFDADAKLIMIKIEWTASAESD